MEHINITVKGKVQGVWFRQSTMEKAIELGINGYTMNLTNGDVFIEAESDEKTLNLFIEWCKIGPEMANVENVNLAKSDYKGFRSFQIVK
ncbi:MAG: acylphosphatase [Bacteroidota bacterium]